MNPPLSSTTHKHFPQVSNGYPLRRTGCILLAGWSLLLLAGFAAAVWLEPDPRGFGTHQAFGLPPCTFLTVFQFPCPSCGMTTSFAHFVRGQWISAARANFGGFCLALTCATLIPWCWMSIYRRRMWMVSKPDVTLVWLVAILCGMAALQWAVRMTM